MTALKSVINTTAAIAVATPSTAMSGMIQSVMRKETAATRIVNTKRQIRASGPPFQLHMTRNCIA